MYALFLRWSLNEQLPLRDSQLFGTCRVGVCLGGVAAYALLRRRPSPDEQERKRRDLLVQQGRIIDATVIDISDLNAEESGRPNGMQLILYKYEAAGWSTSAPRT